jgi:cobalt-zinc-cadmium efflux system protein
VGGVLIALVAGRLSTRPATRFQTFGLLRAEIVGALVNGVFLLGMAVLVFWMGFMRLQDPIHLPPTPMLIVALGGLVTEIISLGLLYQGQKTNLNIKGAYWHILQTFAGSLIIIVAALVIRFTGFLPIDPLLGMAFGIVLLWASWTIIRDALHILLDNVPQDLDLNQVRAAIEAVPSVESVHHMHAWSLTSSKNILSAHALVNDYMQGEEALHEIQELLKTQFQIYFSTIQIETTVCPAEEEAAAIDFMRTAGPKAAYRPDS